MKAIIIIFYNPQLLEQFQKVNLKGHQMLSVKTRSHENSSQKILDYQILNPIQLIFRHAHYILEKTIRWPEVRGLRFNQKDCMYHDRDREAALTIARLCCMEMRPYPFDMRFKLV